jgi:hypothetical protein
MSQRVRAISRVVSPAKVILTLLLIALFSCKKDGGLDVRVLQPGTKCNIYSGVFAPGDLQPAVPVTVTSIFRKASSGLIYYNVTDTNGVVWQIPDNDLQVLK